MIKKDVVTLRGIGVAPFGREASSLQCTLPLSEISEFCSLPDVLEGAQNIIADMSRPVNLSEVKRVQSYLLGLLNNTGMNPLLTVTIAVEECFKEVIDETPGLVSITYSPKKAYIINDIQTIAAYTSITKYESEIVRSPALGIDEQKAESLNSKIAMLPTLINVIYRSNENIRKREIVSLLNSYNNLDTRIHSMSLGVYEDETHPIMLAVTDIARAINIEKFGGMSISSRLTKNDSYVTTQTSMAGLVLAAIGGKSARLTTPLPQKLPNKKIITEELINETKQLIIDFLKVWLSTLGTQFEKDPDGFHCSSQVWQALGLVIHHLHEVDVADSVSESAKVLAHLDYDKAAKHWSNCSALKLDATGKYYINATGGGRSLRDGIAKYFISLL
ncbi:DNA sulfur modification protein DndB [Vibrio sp. 10N.222.54.A3]|uniref:DNA sulfur modification protein DndB n=1 Tax=Vibrio sp. 10N.222.54.A3 TaxID=3229633 RepID=UPI00354B1915